MWCSCFCVLVFVWCFPNGNWTNSIHKSSPSTLHLSDIGPDGFDVAIVLHPCQWYRTADGAPTPFLRLSFAKFEISFFVSLAMSWWTAMAVHLAWARRHMWVSSQRGHRPHPMMRPSQTPGAPCCLSLRRQAAVSRLHALCLGCAVTLGCAVFRLCCV